MRVLVACEESQEVCKADVLRWDMAKRERALRCKECAYRKKYMDEEASHDDAGTSP